MRSLIVIGTVCNLALGVSACGGSSSPSASSSSQSSSSAQAPTLKHTSDAWAAIYARVNSQSEGDAACTTQQSQLGQQVKQIKAETQAVAGMTKDVATGQSAVLVALEYGSPAFPEQFLSPFLSAVASSPTAGVYVNQPDTGDEYNHASVVICVVTVG